MLKYLFEFLIAMICSSAKWLLTWIFVLFHGIALLHELRWKGRGFIYLCKPWSFVDRNLASCPLTQSPLPHWPSLEVIHVRRLPSVQFSSVAQSCPTLCDPMNCSTPGLPVHHQLSVYPNSCPLSWWCHPTIPSPVIPFSSCPQSFPASGSFPMSQLFASGGQSIGVSASTLVLPVNTQDWSPLGWTGWISLQSKGLSTVFSNTTVQKHQFLSAQLSL